MTTMMLLNLALSRTPTKRIQVMARVMRMAGRSTTPPDKTILPAALVVIGAVSTAWGSLIPALWMSPMKVVDQPEATALAATMYSSIRSQPMIQAITSPKAA